MIQKGGKPVVGAYASKAYLLSSGMGTSFAKIKSDITEGIRLYQKEFADYPESREEFRVEYYSLLIGQPEYKASVDAEIQVLKKSAAEKDLLFAADLLVAKKEKAAADSLRETVKLKFPNGIRARSEGANAIAREKDPVKKEALYQAYVSWFQENNTGPDSCPLFQSKVAAR